MEMTRLIECVPNFSEGRNASVVEGISDSVKEGKGVILLDSEMDADHNRCVITFVGTPEEAVEAAFRACRRASELIDMNKHSGEHPRIGATDVIPLIPVSGVSMEECVELSRKLAKRIADELKIPTYLYEQSATRPERRSLSDIRKGEYEGLKEDIRKEERKPDYGNAELHPTAGATVVGARPVLVAYNVYLNTEDLQCAKRIAKRIRERDGGMPGVKALGFYIEKKRMVQVSMNLTDLSKTAPLAAYVKICEEAEKEGVTVHGSEIVGMVPVGAVSEAAEERLKLMDFDRGQILEGRLLDLLLARMAE